MNATKGNASPCADATPSGDELIPPPRGIVPPAAELPRPHPTIPDTARERAALVVLGITRMLMPEQIIRQRSGVDPGWDRITDAFEDALEQREALALVDLIVDALEIAA